MGNIIANCTHLLFMHEYLILLRIRLQQNEIYDNEQGKGCFL